MFIVLYFSIFLLLLYHCGFVFYSFEFICMYVGVKDYVGLNRCLVISILWFCGFYIFFINRYTSLQNNGLDNVK